MKKVILTLAVLATTATAASAGLTDAERDKAIQESLDARQDRISQYLDEAAAQNPFSNQFNICDILTCTLPSN